MTVYCTAPWNGFTVREDGSVKTCCAGSAVLGNLKTSSMAEILNSQPLKKIQSILEQGQVPTHNCQSCVSQEQLTGLASLRQHYLKHYPNVYSGLKLNNLDIRWNNSCNLSCQYCGPTVSSTWQKKLRIPVSSPVKPYQDELEQFILDNIDQVQEITLVGGEPMLMKQNANLLQKLPQQTKISVITNIAYDLERMPYMQNLLDRPQENLLWSLSLENTGSQFEYVRNGASWAEVERNIGFLQQHWPNTVNVLMVYSALSAFDLTNTLTQFHALGLKKFYFQTYFGNPAFDVFAMPLEIQNIAAQELRSAVAFHHSQLHPDDVDLYPIENANAILDKLGTDPTRSLTRQEFLDHVAWCDQWTNLRFSALWLDVIDLVDLYLK